MIMYPKANNQMTNIIAHITHKDNRKTQTGKEHLYSLRMKTMAL